VDDLAGNENLGSSNTAHKTQKHLPDGVSLPEGKMKGQKRCTVCTDKEKHLTGKAHRKDIFYQYTEFNVGPLPFKYFTH
jgi:hypothetical protein